MDRTSQLNDLARKIRELENEYHVSIISSNGYTKALIVDRLKGHGYDYHSGEGRLSHSDDCCIEELD